MSIVVIRFESDNSYSPNELKEFKEAITDAISEIDEDANTKSVDVQTMTEEQAKSETLRTVQDFLDNSRLMSHIEISHPDYPESVEFDLFGGKDEGE